MRADYIIRTEESINQVYNEATQAAEQGAAEKGVFGYREILIKVYGEGLFAKFRHLTGCRAANVPFYQASSAAFAERNESSATIIRAFYVKLWCDVRHGAKASLGEVSSEFIIVCEDGTELQFFPKNRNGKTFTLSLADDYTRYDGDYQFRRVFNEEEPNAVGTLTDTKLHSWIGYLRRRATAYKAMKDEKEQKAAEFIEKMRELAESCEQSRVEDTNGWMVKGILRLSYTIDGDKRISTKVELADMPIGAEQCIAMFSKYIRE